MVIRAWTVAALLLLAWPAPPARAQAGASEQLGSVDTDDTAKAKRLFHEGIDLVAEGRWSEAEASFRSSVELVERASALYNWALALCTLQRFEQCAQVVDRLLALAPGDEQTAQYRDYGLKLRERALQAAAPQPVSAAAPAVSTSQASAPEPRFTAEGGRAVLPAVHAPRPHTSADHSEGGLSAAWIVAGSGALLLTGALVTAILADSADREFMSQCPDAQDCDPSLKPLARRAKTLALATDILLATGAAAVGTGVTLWIIERGDSPGVAGAGVALRGSLP